jgi:hypothetical protein
MDKAASAKQAKKPREEKKQIEINFEELILNSYNREENDENFDGHQDLQTSFQQYQNE